MVVVITKRKASKEKREANISGTLEKIKYADAAVGQHRIT